MIRKLKVRQIPPLFAQERSKDRQAPQPRNFDSKEAAKKHEREVQYFKRH